MPISAPGSRQKARGAGRPRAAGVTLIELLVVMVLVAMASAGIGLALRDPAQAQLEREGERLIALLEAARSEARAGGLDVRWRPLSNDSERHFAFVGLPRRLALPSRWQGEPVAVEIEGRGTELVLGPEPMLPPQALRLRLGAHQLRIASDGLRPFALQS